MKSQILKFVPAIIRVRGLYHQPQPLSSLRVLYKNGNAMETDLCQATNQDESVSVDTPNPISAYEY